MISTNDQIITINKQNIAVLQRVPIYACAAGAITWLLNDKSFEASTIPLN